MSDWHVNEGLAPLLAEARTEYPGIVIGTIGDAAHRKEISDHNPNSAGRVNAADLMLGPAFTEAQAKALIPFLIADRRTKYLIHDGMIWRSPAGHSAAEAGWHPYTGSDPHTNHIHLSVWDSAHTDPAPWEITMPSLDEISALIDDRLHKWAEPDPLSTATPPADGRVGGWIRTMEERRQQMERNLDARIDALSTKLDQVLAKLPN